MKNVAYNIIERTRYIGFTGSRHYKTNNIIPEVVKHISIQKQTVLVGDCRGLDTQIITLLDRCMVFKASYYGTGKSSFALRSIALVNYLHKLGGLLLAFPLSKPHDALKPSADSKQCFAGYGSGTWATVAYAIGKGLTVLLYSEREQDVPKKWGFRQLEENWYIIFTPNLTLL